MSGIPITTNFNDAHDLPLSRYTLFRDLVELMSSPFRKLGVLVYLWETDQHVYWNGVEYKIFSGMPLMTIIDGGHPAAFFIATIDGGYANTTQFDSTLDSGHP